MSGEHISRKAALSFPFANGQYDREHADEHFINGCESYREWIEQLPAADVVEVRHGRWSMLSYDEAVCTCCGYDRNTPFESTKEAKEKWDELPPFCEMCGAKMDGGQDNV